MALNYGPMQDVEAWGRLHQAPHIVGAGRFPADFQDLKIEGDEPFLAIGNRRSYSDVALNSGHYLLDMTHLKHFHSFDPVTATLVADAGVTLDEILRQFVPQGYFLPVTPGTRFVTLGGAVANDVHGKNHHSAGTIGCHVQSIALWRSDMGMVQISRTERPELFAATIGGLGLTGVILSVTLTLQPIGSARLDMDTFACRNLAHLLETLAEQDQSHEHSVAWIDCTATGRHLGRGIVTAANWRSDGDFSGAVADAGPTMPTDRFGWALNSLTVRSFNALYYFNGRMRGGERAVNYAPFFYPLDRIGHWNRIYGRKGFYQYQCVLPKAAGAEPLSDMMRIISQSGEGSFLAVLKNFGAVRSPGLMSFPMEGLTLALDFRNRGAETLALFAQLDDVVRAAKGRLYPAKDARLPTDMLQAGFPALPEFLHFLDPALGSDFSRRVLKS